MFLSKRLSSTVWYDSTLKIIYSFSFLNWCNKLTCTVVRNIFPRRINIWHYQRLHCSNQWLDYLIVAISAMYTWCCNVITRRIGCRAFNYETSRLTSSSSYIITYALPLKVSILHVLMCVCTSVLVRSWYARLLTWR